MAIKRVDPKAIFKVVSQHDEALDPKSFTPEDTGLNDKEGTPVAGPSPYEKYLKDFDSSKLIFKEGLKPDFFHVRCLTNTEVNTVNEKYLEVDTEKKIYKFRNQNQMFMEIFGLAVIGLEDANGTVAKVTNEEVGYRVAVEIGSLISVMTTAGKNLKKA